MAPYWERMGGNVARLAWCCLAVGAVVWAAFVLPIVRQDAPISSMAKGIVAGDSFPSGVLDHVASDGHKITGSKWRHPSTLADVATVDLGLLQRAIDNADPAQIDRRQVALAAAIRRALSSSPADPYLWLMYFWLKNTREGFRPEHLKFLSMSYALGPNEGWIAVIRNRLAVALFPELTPVLQARVIGEFAHLVDSGFVSDAAGILTGPGWPVRERLIPPLKDVDDVYREQLAKMVYGLGFDVTIPGVKPFGFRPWH